MTIYGPLPTFADGQILSAAAHLNSLQRYLQGVHDDFMGTQMPFTGTRWTNDITWTYTWTGYIRHRYNTLRYIVEILSGGSSTTATVKVNDQTVATLSGAGTHNSTASLAALSLTAGQFYSVEVDTGGGDCNAIVWLLREEYAPSYPTLASFANGTTPTAVQWQDLSDYAAEVATESLHPYALGPRVQGGPRTGNHPDIYLWAGTFSHRARYLAYKIHMVNCYHPSNYPDPGGERWLDLRLYYNDTLAMKLRIGGTSGSADGSEYYEEYNAEPAEGHTFEGALDLSTYPGGLAQGNNYQAYAKVTSSTFWDGICRAEIQKLYLLPSTAPVMAGWTTFVDWEHGDYVTGSTGSPQVQDIVDNLGVLAGLTEYANYPAMQAPSYSANDGTDATVKSLFGKRRWRFLHYRNGEEDEPSLVYQLRGQEESVGLDTAKDRWLVLDLDTVENLFPGLDYALTGVDYAMEDVEP